MPGTTIKKTDRAKKRDGDYLPLRPEPDKIFKAPRMPSWLPKYGKMLWKKLVDDLVESGVLTKWDIPAFEQLCVTYSYVRESQDHIDSEGLIVIGAQNKGFVKNPAMDMYTKCMASYVKQAEQFGLTPMARKRIDLNIGKAAKKGNTFGNLGKGYGNK